MINFFHSYKNIPNSNIEDRFKVNFKPVSRPIGTWKEELVRTARAIRNSTNKPLYLCLSGGIDGEVMARSFLEAGIPFTAITLRHLGGTNAHDIAFAIRFCKNYNITQQIIDVDPYSYFEKYVDEYRSVNIFKYLQLFLLETVENLGGYAVIGTGDQVLYTIDNKIHIKFDPWYPLPLDWCTKNNTEHCSFFHLHNPELMASYLKINVIDLLLKNPHYFESHHFMSIEKILVYNGFWPGMERRSKSNGFENIAHWRTSVESKLKQKYPDLLDPLYISIDSIKTQLGI